MDRATTIGELRAAGYPDRTIKEELRENLLARLRAGGGRKTGEQRADDDSADPGKAHDAPAR